MEESALAELLNAEAAKVRQIIAPEAKASPEEILQINESVNKLLRNVTHLQMLLHTKLEGILEKIPPPAKQQPVNTPKCCTSGSGLVTLKSSFASFHFFVSSNNLSGASLEFTDHSTLPPFNVRATSVNSINCIGCTATVTGTAEAGYGRKLKETSFVLVVEEDNITKEAKRSNFKLLLDTGYIAEGFLNSGNIIVGNL